MCIRTFIRGGSIAATLLALAACGGSSSGSSTGQLTIGLTDGPVEDAFEVMIAFSGVQLKAAGDDQPMEQVTFNESSCDEFDSAAGTCQINLLDLQGAKRRVVLNEDLPAGSYEWIRLLVQAERNVMDSYIRLEEGGEMCSLYIPSGANTGLKIVSGITVTANGVSDYTLDFDVRKSITAPPGQVGELDPCAQNYMLKPAIRIVDTTEVGTIAGTVSAALLGNAQCPVDAVSQYDNVAVYVFDNADSDAVADDIDGEQDPVTTASVVYDVDTDTYVYEAGFLLPQDYRLALTCSADLDMADGDEFDATSTDTQEFSFIAKGEVSVETGATAIFDFDPPQT